VAIRGFPPRTGFRDEAAWKDAFDRAATRVPRLPLAEPAAVAALVSGGEPRASRPEPLREYERLLANFPVAGRPWIGQVRAAESAGTLPDDLKPKISLVAAWADRAWYMQHRARGALMAHGLDDRRIFALGEGRTTDAPPAEAAALAFARKLTIDPQAMTDGDVESLLPHFTPQQVAEIVHHVGMAAFLDRLTEAAGLGWADEQR
jgi:alkylhydroperoxidase family enzyme